MEETSLSVAKYTSWEGQEVAITKNEVLQYLVQGNAQHITQREVVIFLKICQAQGMNPWIGDVYLVKYGKEDKAQMITSIEYARARARVQPDCRGWEAGCILQAKDGAIVYSHGLQLEGQTLLGGWFKARPEGWDRDYNLEVNLRMYIKKTKEGVVTRFWTEEKQAQMIRKVAEFQGLRSLWGRIFNQLTTEEEMEYNREHPDTTAPGPARTTTGSVTWKDTTPVEAQFETIDNGPDFTMGSPELGEAMDENPPAKPAPTPAAQGSQPAPEPDPQETRNEFWKRAPKFMNKEWIAEYVDAVARANRTSPDNIMTMAVHSWEKFEAGLKPFLNKKVAEKKAAEAAKGKPAQGPGPGPTPGRQPAKPGEARKPTLVPPAKEQPGRRIGLQEAIDSRDAFMRHPNQVMVLGEMMQQAGITADKLTKGLDKFSTDERLDFWAYCRSKIEAQQPNQDGAEPGAPIEPADQGE